ncbi:hypothetical protein LWF15_34410 [Kineosporia rhizophila]|uniref:hypothetical protein n=1 Tax=Kineosporia TaxID=49184 RepID=UPI001E3B59EE|nr:MULTISPECIES: hypothetical protein [Kineosporia]MCE0540601.1 hypothetical protein [Kineosporia rhizophila]GLY14100.1 hypothetical protein Kisp01_11160 [Kineosporia sp. NBRC 101677]
MPDTTIATSTEEQQRAVVGRTERLRAALGQVTLEEYRSEDARFERDSRLGRELLYLVANNSWCRRTTEVLRLHLAEAVDTDVVVDVDLSYADHEAFELDAGLTWLPLLALPPMKARDTSRTREAGLFKEFAARNQVPIDRWADDEADPIASLEVSDGDGTRIHRLTQAEVRQRLAAALAEMILNVMTRRPQQVGPEPGAAVQRAQKLLLSAAIRRMLPGASPMTEAGQLPAGGTVPDGIRDARTLLDEILAADVELALSGADEPVRQPVSVPFSSDGGFLAPGATPFGREQPGTAADETAGTQAREASSIPDQSGTAATGTVDAEATVPMRVRPKPGLDTEVMKVLTGPGATDAPGTGPITGPITIDSWLEDGGRLRPVLGSHVGEILDALIGTTLVVIAVRDQGRPMSYTVHVPSRRLVRRGRAWFQPRALLSIDLLAPTAHADRQIRLVLPEGVVCRGDRVQGRIDVELPGPFERLEALMRRLFPRHLPPDRPASWVDVQIAEMALHKLDSALDSLRYYLVEATHDELADDGEPRGLRQLLTRTPRRPSREHLTRQLDEKLRELRVHLDRVRAAGVLGDGMAAVWRAWDSGSWFPRWMRRRVDVNTASVNLVMLRASAVDDIAIRARPIRARIEADLALSEVSDVARYTGGLNLAVLGVLCLMLLKWPPHQSGAGDAIQVLATILTLFAAVLAGRVELGQAFTLRGLLTRATYWLMFGSVLPTVLLAMALALMPVGYAFEAALTAFTVQALLMLRFRPTELRRSRPGRRSRSARMRVMSAYQPDYARVDMLRGRRSRALITEALLLGRDAFAYVVTRPAGEGQLLSLLERSQAGGSPVTGLTRTARRSVARLLNPRGIEQVVSSERVNLLGAVQSATAGRAMTYLVFRDQPVEDWRSAEEDKDDVVAPVPLDPDRVAPQEPPEWQLQILIGVPVTPVAVTLGRHPVMAVVSAAARYNFQVSSVQLPTAPPPGRSGEALRWMQLSVGVTYRRGDSLRGLGSFLHRVHRMDGMAFGAGRLSILVQINADSRPLPALSASKPLSDKDFDVVPDDEAASDPERNWRTLVLTAHSRVGLLRDVLHGLSAQAPNFELAGLTVEGVYGQTVLFLVGRDRSTSDPSLREGLQRWMRPSDRLIVAVDRRLSARTLDGSAALRERLLLQVFLRTPDRPGVLRETLKNLARALEVYGPEGHSYGEAMERIDVWFVTMEVANGRTFRGRLTVRLPGEPDSWAQWAAVDWPAVERSLSQASAQAARGEGNDAAMGGAVAIMDDTVITVELMRIADQRLRPLSPPD